MKKEILELYERELVNFVKDLEKLIENCMDYKFRTADFRYYEFTEKILASKPLPDFLSKYDYIMFEENLERKRLIDLLIDLKFSYILECFDCFDGLSEKSLGMKDNYIIREMFMYNQSRSIFMQAILRNIPEELNNLPIDK